MSKKRKPCAICERIRKLLPKAFRKRLEETERSDSSTTKDTAK